MRLFARELWLSPVRRTSLLLFVLALVTSAYFVQGAGMNQSSRFDLARAIAVSHTLSIDEYQGNTLDRSERDGHYYSDKAPGLAFASVPVVLLEDALDWPGPDRPALGMHFVTVAVIGTSSAVASVLLFFTLLALGIARTPATLGVVGWLLGTNAFGYLTLYYGHQFTAALLVSSFCLLYASQEPERARVRWLVPAAGALAAWAAISEYPAAVPAAMLAVYGVVAQRARGRTKVEALRATMPFALAALLPLLLSMAYNDACFGGPFRLGYASLANEYKGTMNEGFFGLTTPKLHVLYEILFGEPRGLLWLSPFLLLAVPGAVILLRRRASRREAWLAAGVTAFFLLLNASYAVWSGGASMGPRHVVPMLPFATLLATGALDAAFRMRAPWRAIARLGSLALLAASVAICTMTVAVMPELIEQRFIRSPGPGVSPDMLHPLRTFVIPSFVRGYVSAKGTLPSGQMGIAATAPGHDWDAYNLGEAMGLRGLSSLAPLFLVWGLLAAATLWPAPARDPA